jgi:hypothetical protein
MRLASIFLYPVKSGAGIELAASELDDFGLAHDRRFMLVDARGDFVTQRDDPRLARLRPRIDRDELLLALDGAGERRVALSPTTGDPLRVRVWSAGLAAIAPDRGVDAWLSAAFERPLRLVFLPDASFRRIDSRYVAARRRTSFTDGFPLLVIGAASLADLNARLARPLPMDRFRPNLVIEGAAPFAEDAWQRIRIGAVELALVKPCSRCMITTTDQARGARDGDEPLRTLASYRRRGGEVYFGMNAVHAAPGRIAVGEAVEVVA